MSLPALAALVVRRILFWAFFDYMASAFQTNPAQTQDYLSLILSVELGKGVTIAQLMTSGLAVIARGLSCM